MNRIRCLAINPQWYEEYFLSFPLGLATIAAIVVNKGCEVQWIDFDADRINDQVKAAFLEKASRTPDVVLLTGMITNYARCRTLAGIIKNVWPESILVLGGSLSTTAPDIILNTISADAFVLGEGDDKIKWIIDAIASGTSLTQVPGIKIKDGNGIYSTQCYNNPPDITKTPRPDYEAFPMGKYINFLKMSGRCFEIYTSKGCPFSCNYCFRMSGKNIRFRLVDEVINEIQFVRDTYMINRFSFEDDCFGLNKDWLHEFCKKIKKLEIKFRFQASINTLEETTLDQLQEAGLFGVSMGIESASPSILSKMKKKVSLIKAEKLIQDLRSRGIKYNATFILGMPEENEKSIELLKEFLVRNGFSNNFQIFFLAPYPGTEIYNEAVAGNIIKDEREYIEHLKLQDTLNVNLTPYPSEKLLEWKKYILEEVAKAGNGPLMYSGATWKNEAL